jgi:hypothetical protein
MGVFSKLDDRVDYFYEPESGVGNFYHDILTSVLNGSHVIVYGKANLKGMVNKNYKGTGRCDVAIVVDDFRRSRDPIFSTTSAWLYRYFY